MNSLRTLLAASLLALVAVPAMAATNLVVNGSFEQTPAFNSWTTFYGYNALPGWNAGTYGVEVQRSGVTVNAQDGINVVELDTYANSYIWQEIATTPGQTYHMSFYYAPRPGYGFESNKMVFKFGNFFDWTSAVAIDGTEWYYISGSTVAESETTRLGFLAWGWSDGVGGLIDNVSVHAAPVPEPETYAMLGAGLFAIAALRRRRRV